MSRSFFKQDGVPAEANASPDAEDLWSDTDDEKNIYVNKATYDNTSSEIFIPAADRPSVALTFTLVNPQTNPGDTVAVIINNAGPSGTSTFVQTGTGTLDDPFLFTLNMFEDDSSNGRINTLITGGPILEVDNVDLTDGSFTALPRTFLSQGNFSNWKPVVLNLVYDQKLPDLLNSGDIVSKSVPLGMIVGEGLANRAAWRLFNKDEGGDLGRANAFNAIYRQELDDVIGHRNEPTQPSDVSPG